MNFFQKLTGSLKMPQDEELFSEGSRAHQQTPGADQTKDAPNLAPQAQISPEELQEKSEIKTASFKHMFAEEPDTPRVGQGNEGKGFEEIEEEQTPDFESPIGPIGPEEQNEETLVTAHLAKAKTHTTAQKSPVMSVLKKTLPHIRLKKEEEEPAISAPEGQLAIDVYETPTEVVIKSTIAGVKPEDLDVGIEENTINIRGSRHNEEKVKGEDYFYQECYWGTFSRSVILPVEVDADRSQAALKDGILTIRLPKITKEKEKKIKILS